MEDRVVVGLDLGNAFLRVYFAGKAILMYNSLLLEKGNVYINKKPTNHCLVDIPLLAGFKFDDAAFQDIAKHYNYDFRKGSNRSILAKLHHETAIEEFHPELALLLMLRGVFMTNPYLKYLIAQKPIKLVVTVFEGDSNSYRLALTHSLTAIGVSHFSLVSTPACIAVAYLRDSRQQRDEREVVAVVDFGDRGLTVTICKVFSQEVGVVEVLRSEFSHLGGNHLTNLLSEHVVRQLAREKGMDVSRTPKIMHRLKVLCDEAKKTLSQSEMAFVRLDGLPDILVYGCEVSALQFENCVKGALQHNIDVIKSALSDFRVGKIILSGSSSKIPVFRSLMGQHFKQYKTVLCNEEWM
jgi:molecular chaperone DnaK (HSP70)